MATRQGDNNRFTRTGGTAPRRSQASGQPTGTRFKTQATGGSAPASGTRRTAGSPYQRTTAPQGVRSAYASRSAAPAKRRSSVIPAIIAVVAVIALIAAFIFFAVPALSSMFAGSAEPEVEAGIEVQVNIPEGASGDQIASILSQNNVIPDPKDYYSAVRELKADMQIKPGDYLFTTLQDPVSVVEQLMEGPNVEGVTLTIAEGLTVKQTAARVEEVYGIAADDFLAQAKASTYVADYPFLEGAADDSLEGFLYPKTYSFSGTPTSDEIIRAMLNQYQTEVASLDFESARSAVAQRYGVELSDYEMLTLASIIEREALTEDQRYKVSSTFYNRLEQGMALQSDATMMYVTGGEVTADDLHTESPYNTYLNQGLPPTPICSPSLASIKAALEPADTNYLYFFITFDNEYFSETYDQHLEAIEENR